MGFIKFHDNNKKFFKNSFATKSKKCETQTTEFHGIPSPSERTKIYYLILDFLLLAAIS